MKATTRYAYQARIKELEAEVNRMEPYERLARRLFDSVAEVVAEGKGINCGWLLKQFRDVFR